VDEAAQAMLAQSRGNGDGKAQEASHLRGCAGPPIERLAARILEHQHGPTSAAREASRPLILPDPTHADLPFR
jgi:hypothetical protein